jgi:pentose-5-phosphate-3-epimerase
MSVAVPAILPSSYEDLQGKISLFTKIPLVDRVQIDVVDGEFVKPASWPYNTSRELQELIDRGEMLPKLDRITYEIDLMCLDIERACGDWLSLGAKRLTLHAQSEAEFPELLASVTKRYGLGADFVKDLVSFGIALPLQNNLELVEPCLDQVAYVQYMGIAQVGKQGQPFDERVFNNISTFRNRHPNIPVQVDGGVSFERAQQLLALGVTNVIVGSALAQDPSAAFAAFENLKTSYGV